MSSDQHDPGTEWFRRVPGRIVLLIAIGVGVAISVVVIETNSSSAPQITAPYTVVFSVTGSVAAADITWSEDIGANQPTSAFIAAHRLPWSKTAVVKGGFPTFTLTAMASTAQQTGALTCKITVNGQTRSAQTLAGADPSVACGDSETGS